MFKRAVMLSGLGFMLSTSAIVAPVFVGADAAYAQGAQTRAQQRAAQRAAIQRAQQQAAARAAVAALARAANSNDPAALARAEANVAGLLSRNPGAAQFIDEAMAGLPPATQQAVAPALGAAMATGNRGKFPGGGGVTVEKT